MLEDRQQAARVVLAAATVSARFPSYPESKVLDNELIWVSARPGTKRWMAFFTSNQAGRAEYLKPSLEQNNKADQSTQVRSGQVYYSAKV